jgi:hypothetical protein
MSIENLNPMIALASDPALFDFSEKVGKNYDLQIDQIGEMDSLIRSLLLGTIKPSEFNDLLIQKLEISKALADKLVEFINVELPPIIKNYIFKKDSQPVLEQKTTPVVSSPVNQKKDSSPHADLEQAGNFKIETEASFDGNYTMKAPPKKSPFAQEQKAQWTNANPADMAMFSQNPPSPTQTQPSQPISQSDPQPQQTTPPETDAGTASKMQAFDPKNFYNFGNIEEQMGDKKENKDDNREEVMEEKKAEDKPEAPVAPKTENQIFQKSASAIHFEKESKNKHSRFTASQAYQPKVKEISPEPSFDSKQNQNQTVENEEQSETEKENTALIDELMAHPKVIIPEKSEKIVSPPQNLPTENLPTENITPEKQTEKSADSQVDNKFVSAFEPTPVSITPEPIPVPVEPELIKAQPDMQPAPVQEEVKLVQTPVEPVSISKESTPVEPVPIPTPIPKEPEVTAIPPEPQTTVLEPSIEEIRNDIRSKVSEYNPTTTWPTTPIQAPSEKPRQPKPNSL